MMFPKNKWKAKTSKKGPRSLLIRRCLAAWSKVVVRRFGDVCAKCGARGANSHHIITRGTCPAMWWFAPDYGVRLCIECHMYTAHSTDFDRQKHFNDWVRGYVKTRGQDYDTMHTIARSRGQNMKDFDLDFVFKSLMEQLKLSKKNSN